MGQDPDDRAKDKEEYWLDRTDPPKPPAKPREVPTREARSWNPDEDRYDLPADEDDTAPDNQPPRSVVEAD